MTLPVITLVLSAALVNGLHPVLTSTLPLVYGSLLGNEVRPARARRALVLYGCCLGMAWAICGLGLNALIAYGLLRFNALPLMIGGLLALVGLLELKTARAPRGLAMSVSPSTWRRLRKHAYRLAHPSQVVSFLAYALPYLLIFTAAPYLGAITLTNAHLDSGSALLAVVYGLLVMIPFALLAVLSFKKVKLSVLHHWLSTHQALFHVLQGIMLLALGLVLGAGNYGSIKW